MDIATLIGIVVAGGLVITSILMGGPGAWFINYPSLMIVVGGTMGATLLAYPLADVLGVFRVAKNVFLHKSQSPVRLIPVFTDLARQVRKEGFLSLESQLDRLEPTLLQKGLRMASDGMDAHFIEEVMTTEILQTEERHRLGAEIFTTMGTFAPAVGMLGTIIGLVQMLMQMEDPSQIGAPMAVALLTTFYGTILANLVFLPIAGKLKTRSKQEMLTSQIVMEGVVMMVNGANHHMLMEKLTVFLAPPLRHIDTSEESA